jgi:large subunit ribosomal protein L3
MQSALITKKGAMSQRFDANSKRIPVTLLHVDQVFLTAVKTSENDGYTALKFACGNQKRIDKPTQGVLKKVGIEGNPAIVKEVRVNTTSDRISYTEGALKSGDQTVSLGAKVPATFMFKVGDMVDVTGTSKGKGFQGGVKRHNFSGGPKTHGQSDRWRAPGSVGATTTPGRTFKGQRMAGRMGGDTVTVRNLQVIAVDENSVVVQGLVPGRLHGTIVVRLAQ